MKRSKLGVAITAFFITFLAVGCSNTSSNNSSNGGSDKYTTYMNQGKDAASSQKYETAEEKFEDAHDVKATSESKAYADQAGDMKDAQEEIREYEFKDALGKAANKTNGYSVMTKQASKLYKTIDKVQDHITNDINPLYKKAKLSYRDGDYQAAVESCDQILDLPYINSKYYKKVKKNVKHLRKVANAKLNSENVNDDIDTENLDANDDDEATTSNKQSSNSKSSSSNSSNTNNTSSNSNKSSSNSNSSNSQDNNAASQKSSATSSSSNTTANNNNSNTNSSSTSSNDSMMINGQTVTGRVISQTRNQLSSIGVDTSSWSDQKVVDFMRSAANSGHTTIDSYTKQDVENFK